MNKYFSLIAIAIIVVLGIFASGALIQDIWLNKRNKGVSGYVEKPNKSREDRIKEEEKALRERHNSVRIYAVSNRFEVWCMGTFPGKWKDAETLEEAREIVTAYYRKWAENCIGPEIPGTLVE